MHEPPTRKSPSPAVPSAAFAVAVLAALLTLTGCGSAAPDQPPVVSAFTAAGSSGGAAFRWTAADPDGDSLTCTLDANDDGVPDATIKNCQTNASDTVSYPDPGTYTAMLTVDDHHDHTATATTGVIAAGTSTAPPLWTARLGSPTTDHAEAVALDSNDDVVIGGSTQGTLFTALKGTYADGFVARLDAFGRLKWGRQLGGADTTLVNGVALDSNHDVVATGSRDANGSGVTDSFVARYDPFGTLLWDRQLGASGGDMANAIAVDSQHAIIVVGSTNGAIGGANQGASDPFIVKLSSDGNQILWARQPGTSANESAAAVAVDANDDIVIAGSRVTSAFVAEYDASGTQLWMRDLGSGQSVLANSVAIGANGDIAVAGYTVTTDPATNQTSTDGLVALYDQAGSPLWTKSVSAAGNPGPLGGSPGEELYGVAVDATGDVVVTGWHGGWLTSTQYGWLATTSKYDPSGNRIWVRDISSHTASTKGLALALDSHADPVVIGTASGALSGTIASGAADVLALSYPP